MSLFSTNRSQKIAYFLGIELEKIVDDIVFSYRNYAKDIDMGPNQMESLSNLKD